MSHIIRKTTFYFIRKPAFCICENKDADQLRGNREADQRLCLKTKTQISFAVTAKLISAFVFAALIVLLSKSEISSI